MEGTEGRKEWKCGLEQGDDRTAEALAGNEEIDADRRCRVTDFKIGQKDNTKMYRIYTVPRGQWKDQRHHNDDGRKNIHHRAHNE